MARVFDFVRGLIQPSNQAPEPPPYDPAVPGGMAYFMDEDERTVLYQKPWPYKACPYDDRTSSTTHFIGGQYFSPSRQDAAGNWILRRCVG